MPKHVACLCTSAIADSPGTLWVWAPDCRLRKRREGSMADQPGTRRKIPLGVYILALLLFMVGAIWLLAAVALPLLGVSQAPWYIYLAGAAYFLVVGWGIWGARRWAYFAALLMCVVL